MENGLVALKSFDETVIVGWKFNVVLLWHEKSDVGVVGGGRCPVYVGVGAVGVVRSEREEKTWHTHMANNCV